MEEKEIIENGVYRLEPFSTKPNYNWCKHNILIARKDDHDWRFYDTYWADGHTNYPFDEVKDRITFLFDLKGSKEVKSKEYDQYEEEDKFFIPDGGHDKSYLIKAGAEKSRAIIINLFESKIENIKSEIESLQRNLEWKKETLEEIKNGGDIDSVFV